MSTTIHYSADSLFCFNLRNEKAGNYRLTVSANDKFGKPVAETYYFNVYESTKSATYNYQPLSISLSGNMLQYGEELLITMSSYLENAKVYYEISQGKKTD